MNIASFGASVPGLECHEFDVDIGPKERAVVQITINEDVDHGAILIEGEAEVAYEGIDYSQVEPPRQGTRYIFTGFLKGGHRIKLFIGNAVKRRVRVLSLFFRRQAMKVWNELPCSSCKLAVKVVVHLVFHHISVPLEILHHVLPAPLPSWQIPSSAKAQIAQLGTPSDQSSLGQLLRNLPNWGIIKDVLGGLDYITGALDQIYSLPCVKFGCCP
jgi:hypothetical protein